MKCWVIVQQNSSGYVVARLTWVALGLCSWMGDIFTQIPSATGSNIDKLIVSRKQYYVLYQHLGILKLQEPVKRLCIRSSLWTDLCAGIEPYCWNSLSGCRSLFTWFSLQDCHKFCNMFWDLFGWRVITIVLW